MDSRDPIPVYTCIYHESPRWPLVLRFHFCLCHFYVTLVGDASGRIHVYTTKDVANWCPGPNLSKWMHLECPLVVFYTCISCCSLVIWSPNMHFKTKCKQGLRFILNSTQRTSVAVPPYGALRILNTIYCIFSFILKHILPERQFTGSPKTSGWFERLFYNL